MGGFALTGRRVGHGRVIFTEKLTAWAFEALQVIPRHCLLMEFGVRWVSELSKLGGGGGVQLGRWLL